MLTASLSEFRKNTKKYLDNIIDNAETLIVNRGHDKGIVILSLDEYNAIHATLHELSSKRNEAILDASIEQLKDGKVKIEDLTL